MAKKLKKPKIKIKTNKTAVFGIIGITILLGILSTTVYVANQKQNIEKAYANTITERDQISEELETTLAEFEEFKTADQVQINEELNAKIKEIENAFSKAVTSYENLLKLKDQTKDSTEELDDLYTKSLTQLSDLDYEAAAETLAELDKKIKEELDKIAAAAAPKVTALCNGCRVDNANEDRISFVGNETS